MFNIYLNYKKKPMLHFYVNIKFHRKHVSRKIMFADLELSSLELELSSLLYETM